MRRGTRADSDRDRLPPGGRSRRTPGLARVYLLTVVLAVLAVTTAVTVRTLLDPWPGTVFRPAAKSFFPPSTRFYTDPDNPAARWVRDNPGDRRAALIDTRIAARPQAAWIVELNQDAVLRQVRTVVRKAEARAEVPILVAYAIPRRDCDGASAGGTGDLAAYRLWIDQFARGLGPATAVVILEPDALAHLECLDPRQRTDRLDALASAARSLRDHAPRTRVYYDAGNSGWHSPSTMAERLERAGIKRYGDGIALNISNFNATRDEARYGLSVLVKLGDSRLAMVIDTSRNGAGPTKDHRFCDPPGRKLGAAPTTETGIAGVDAYLWVKHPGQADGCVGEAGAFDPDYAYRLAN